MKIHQSKVYVGYRCDAQGKKWMGIAPTMIAPAKSNTEAYSFASQFSIEIVGLV